MAGFETGDEISKFLESGIYRMESSNAVFLDPVRVINRFYTRFRVLPSAYYSRFFDSNRADKPRVCVNSKKRKRKRKEKKKVYAENERERAADLRHQEARPWLLKAHESLLKATELLSVVPSFKGDGCFPEERNELLLPGVTHSFVELGKVWQAPLYEISLNIYQNGKRHKDEGCVLT